MAQTFSKLLVHVVFSTKDRKPLITTDLKDRLFGFMSNSINKEFGYPIRINGVEDHVHLLVDAKPTTAPADMLRVVKSNSSGWVHDTFPHYQEFAWQTGYGIFSVSESQKNRVIEYIKGQEAPDF